MCGGQQRLQSYPRQALNAQGGALVPSLLNLSCPVRPEPLSGKHTANLLQGWPYGHCPRWPAAAFINQLHRAELARGETLAIKVQYLGLIRSIELEMSYENKVLTCSHLRGLMCAQPGSELQCT